MRGAGCFDMDEVVERWQDSPDLVKLGAGALLHGLLDVVVDSHFDTIQLMDDAIESLEDRLFDEKANVRELQQRTYLLRKELVELRRVVLPMREVVNTVMRHRADSNGHTAELDGWYTPEGRASILPKIIRPAGVCSTLVTTRETSCPTWFRPCSMTTIVPSSR